MTRPSLEASESEILAFARDWARFAAKHGLDEALRLIDRRDSEPAWSEAFVRRMHVTHFIRITEAERSAVWQAEVRDDQIVAARCESSDSRLTGVGRVYDVTVTGQLILANRLVEGGGTSFALGDGATLVLRNGFDLTAASITPTNTYSITYDLSDQTFVIGTGNEFLPGATDEDKRDDS